jgi:hypothetical protein
MKKEGFVMYNIRRVILLLSLALLLIGIVPGCGPPPPPPTEPPEEATATPKPLISEDELAEIRRVCQVRSEEGRKRQHEHPEYEDLLYIEGYTIVTGPREAISDLLRLLKLQLEPVDAIDLSSLSEYGFEKESLEFLRERYEKQGGSPTDPAELSETTIQLYQIGDRQSVEQVVCEINELAARAKLAVFADPNYNISPADWAGGGSPWTQNGKWAEERPPGGGFGEAPRQDFRTQWAFSSTGIDLFDDGGVRLGVLEEHRGAGIRVGIFDTSPFTEVEVGEEEQCMHCFPFGELFLGDVLGASAEAEPRLTVWHHRLIPSPNCPGYDRHSEDRKSLESQDISNHGLFVAGLIHAVVPHSEIYLVRVLEKDGCGGLFGINKGIKMFMDETLQDRDTLEGTVINLSLGVHKPPEPSQLGLPDEVQSLERILETAVGLGAVVVAAAGNDSYDKPSDSPSSMELPAEYPFVIGVAASSIRSGRGCFSNRGDVAAPGGDGRFLDEETRCAIPDCLKDPDLCLISLAPNSKTGYAYWVGTSFSTPLVSGLASLLLDAGVPPAHIADQIEGSAVWSAAYEPALGGGVINLPASLP